MMRPMKLAGSELMFGKDSLEYIKSLPEKKIAIVIGGTSMEKCGILGRVEDYFHENGAETRVIRGVEPDPHFSTVVRGASEMKEFEPDLIVALGGGSVMDAAKTMWIYYENEDFTTLADVMPPHPFPKLRKKARFCCIPSTSGTASEVSRSVVISDDETGMKHGLGNMEMMPDIAICDPEVTASMPAHITAETGMDALTHALEALVSNRANYLSNVLAVKAAKDIIETLPKAYVNGKDMEARETMLNASMIAGMAFTNVSLGIVHSMAHTLGGYFGIAHGLADAILLPYIVEFNSEAVEAREAYTDFVKQLNKKESLQDVIRALNKELKVPMSLHEIILDEEKYEAKIHEMAEAAMADGCTKTNPVMPTVEQLEQLFRNAYKGK
ncbi:MAG: iron-containing alcohol dehydrogenase [Acetivibrio sp.]